MDRLNRSVDAASLAAFRVLFGSLMCAALIRSMATGWIEEVLVQPTFFFKYAGAEWMPVWSPDGLYLHLGVTAFFAALVAIGLFYRVAIIGFVLGFASIQLMDQTNYLNHYYLVVLLGSILAILPANRVASIDAVIWPKVRQTVPVWMVGLLRFQIACVYVFAALAKLTPDWLLHGQPLGIWLSSRAERMNMSLLAEPWVPLTMSWCGFLYDMTIVGFLLWHRSRPLAYLVVVVFHTFTWLLFDIGMFPFIMVAATTLFFEPDWPRRLLRRAPLNLESVTPTRLPRWGIWLLGAWCAFHVLFPLRHYALDGDVLWGERGMRWSWKVLVRSKSGAITFHVTDPKSGREFLVSPSRYLEPRQESEMSGQPDMIWQLAQHVQSDFDKKGYPNAEVRVEAWVSLNGRPQALLLDPKADLAGLQGDEVVTIIQPAPTTQPGA